MIQAIATCRSCGRDALEPVLDLGVTPLANRLLKADELGRDEARYPLRVAFCCDCTLVQLTDTVPPEQLFSEYVYLSSFSDTVLDNARATVERVLAARLVEPGRGLVIELASNDGYLLQHYQRAGVATLGIEPAANIARLAQQRHGIETINDFFTADLATCLARQGRRADVLHANNVLAHVADLNGFVRGIATVLRERGTALIEVPYLKDLIDHVEFDTIYHEHLCYFSLTALDALFARHGLVIADVQRLAIHGGSLRLWVRHARASARGDAVMRLLDDERRWAVRDLVYYKGFSQRVARLGDEVRSVLHSLRAAGKRIAVYGASAKGSTLQNYLGIGRDFVEFVADRSTVKQGMYTPGTHLPIVSPDALAERMPDYTLLLSWNFRDEILAQQRTYRARGGRFIVPIPKVEVI